MQSFFDRYSKNADNEWEKTPRVRLSLIGFGESPAKTIVERVTEGFPVPNTEYRTYFLDASVGSLSKSKPEKESKTAYEAHHLTDSSDFVAHFDQYTELAGYPTVKLFMSCDEHNDLDVVVQLRKVGKDGKPLVNLNYKCPVSEPEVPDTNIAKFLGPDGMLRASHRVSRGVQDGRVHYSHDKAEKIPKGKIVELEIPLWPMGMVFEAGEGLMLRVAGHELRLPEVEAMRIDEPIDENVGLHRIHTGGVYDSLMTVPVIRSGKL